MYNIWKGYYDLCNETHVRAITQAPAKTHSLLKMQLCFGLQSRQSRWEREKKMGAGQSNEWKGMCKTQLSRLVLSLGFNQVVRREFFKYRGQNPKILEKKSNHHPARRTTVTFSYMEHFSTWEQ